MAEARTRILVVDDDGGVVDYLCEMLQDNGYEPHGLTSPQTALSRIREDPFDLIIADVEMPGIRGIDLLAAILSDRPQQLVLLITAFGTIDLAVSAVRAGACDFVTKPFKLELLLLAIERALRERQMRREIVRLRSALPVEEPGELVARSQSMRRVVALARRAARGDSTILLTGETGTGKSALARFIHDVSGRDGEFVQLNCAALPPSLVESELFGVRKGAFTDAREDRPGLFLAAARGTLFLDEIGDLPLDLQAKLLHVLEGGRVRPLGATTEHPVSARVVAATNRSLEEQLRDGRFRPDLYYRLNVIRIDAPALRERSEDIAPLVDLFLRRASDRQGRTIIGMAASAMRLLTRYRWPGNVRELANAIERAIALSDHDTIVAEDLDFLVDGSAPHSFDQPVTPVVPLDEIERTYIQRVVEATGGNKAAAARALGIDRRTLYRKIQS
jgi:DNA-binding NtrC family response regulator